MKEPWEKSKSSTSPRCKAIELSWSDGKLLYRKHSNYETNPPTLPQGLNFYLQKQNFQKAKFRRNSSPLRQRFSHHTSAPKEALYKTKSVLDLSWKADGSRRLPLSHKIPNFPNFVFQHLHAKVRVSTKKWVMLKFPAQDYQRWGNSFFGMKSNPAHA